MTTPLWVSVAVAIVSGIFGRVISHLVADVLSKRRWRGRKGHELKHSAFESALNAISA